MRGEEVFICNNDNRAAETPASPNSYSQSVSISVISEALHIYFRVINSSIAILCLLNEVACCKQFEIINYLWINLNVEK